MLKLFSPAKINLFFKLKNKRTDGYHNLQSFFQAINLGDEISIDFSNQDSLTCTDPTVPLDSSNFAHVARDLFRDYSSHKDPISISIDKKIPIGGGLGGGSSNGATVLWGLNELYNRPFNTPQLIEIGSKISSDSAFFFSGGSALCEGRGEIVRPMPSFEFKNGWLIVPNFGMSTKEVYHYSSSITHPNDECDHLLKRVYSNEPYLVNDLEKAAFLLEPRLALIKDSLIAQKFNPVVMTGSGSGIVCFGSARPKEEKDINIYPISYIKRPLDRWYSNHREEYATV